MTKIVNIIIVHVVTNNCIITELRVIINYKYSPLAFLVNVKTCSEH